VTASGRAVSQRMSNDSVKFTYYPFEALGSRSQETEKESKERNG
jgi:hypothetical protein